MMLTFYISVTIATICSGPTKIRKSVGESVARQHNCRFQDYKKISCIILFEICYSLHITDMQTFIYISFSFIDERNRIHVLRRLDSANAPLSRPFLCCLATHVTATFPKVFLPKRSTSDA